MRSGAIPFVRGPISRLHYYPDLNLGILAAQDVVLATTQVGLVDWGEWNYVRSLFQPGK